MGLLPDLLPGYVPVSDAGAFAEEYAGMPATPGKTVPEMLEAAQNRSMGALLVVGANPVGSLQYRSSNAEEHVCGGAGPVPDGDGGAGGCGVSGGEFV